jgi:peptidoglycan/xylan/chitin deacetylase (PgdA/CDA1 family)
MGRLVLTYHMTRLEAWTRAGADLLSLRADLSQLAEAGVPVLSLDALLAPGCRSGVAITFDDGTRMDAEATQHPRFGALPSALSVLREFAPRLPRMQVASFVIASPEARQALAAALADEYGPDLMHARWWAPASDEGLLSIENHSWDHNHPAVPRTAQRDNRRGSFAWIETEAEAEAEVAAASEYIRATCGRRPRWFAYPFGEASDCLRREWLPRRGPELGLQGAFSTEPRALAGDDERWHLPRFVCGRDWRDEHGLGALLGRWL